MSGYDADRQLEEILENIRKMREAEQRHRDDALLKTAELRRAEEKEASEKMAAEQTKAEEDQPELTFPETEYKETDAGENKTEDETEKDETDSEKKREISVKKPQRKSDFARALSGDVVEMKTMEVSF